MIFFAIIRSFGILWFSAEYVETTLPEWGGLLLLWVMWFIDSALMLKTLTSITWKKVLIISLCLLIVFIALQYLTPVLSFVVWEVLTTASAFIVLLVIPLFLTQDKELTLGYSLFYVLGISLYQIVMRFGRGYPAIGMMSPSWQIVSTIDYRLFLLAILLMKGAVVMEKSIIPIPNNPPTCWLFWDSAGKVERLARRIGHEILTLGGLIRHTHD